MARSKRCGKLHGHRMLRFLTDKLHVGLTGDEAFEHVRGKLKPGAWDALSPALKRAFECEVKRVHAENQGVYTAVMTGRF